jgi:DNA polymerase-3 subunit epsilon
MRFFVIDVETANADLASICQIGLVSFQEKKIIETWESFINPEDEFDSVNISIHGITEEKVASAPVFPNVYENLYPRLEGQIVVSHMPFDRIALARVIEKYDLPILNCTWLDSAKVARRAWKQFAYSGYGLANLAKELEIELRHHDALEDAHAAGEILIKAMNETGMEISEWLERVNQPVFDKSSYLERIKKDGNPEGHLFGEIVVFTGALSMSRKEAAEIAAQAGCQVNPSVTDSTTMLVVGDQDIKRLAGNEKSSKHRKAEMLIGKGHNIRILAENDFVKITGG